MKLKMVLLFSVYVPLLLLSGCSKNEETEREIAETAEAEVKAPEIKKQPMRSPEEEAETVKEEDTVTSEAIQIPVPKGTKPEDTVPFVESDKEEITEIHTEESVVDEEDPDTYQTVLKEEQVSADQEIPEEYTDNIGNIVYEYADGIWYHYEYSSGDVALDEKDEEFALFLLNLDGSYDDYEIQNIECEEKEDDGSGVVYAYHVLYRKAEAMTGEPTEADVEHLNISRVREETTAETVYVEEKVPVPVETEIGTGTYRYFGWQNLDGNIYYFDGNGDKVTGSQIIRGIRYEFDAEGVLQSRAGIDVSERNGEIDWAKVKEAGIDFALIRVGYRGCQEGMLMEDSRCAEYLRGASEAGIETGAYFFSQAVTEEEALEDAEFVLNMISEYSITMPVGICTEYAADEYHTRADSLSVQERTSCIDAFCRKISEAGYMPAVCGSEAWISDRLDRSMLGEYEFWLSKQDFNATYTEPFTILQYSIQGELDGVGGSVNMDISYGK